MHLTFIAKTTLFVLAFAACQYLGFALFPEVLAPDEYLCNAVAGAKADAIFFFGDSTTFAYSSDDESDSPVYGAVFEVLHDQDLIPIVAVGADVRTFATAFEVALEAGARPSSVVVCVSPHFFSDYFQRNPHFDPSARQFSLYSMRGWRRPWFKPLSTFKWCGKEDTYSFFREVVLWEGSVRGTYGDLWTRQFLNEDWQRLMAQSCFLSSYVNSELNEHWLEFMERLNSLKIPLVVYLSPIDYQRIEQLTDTAAREKLDANRRLLLQLFDRPGVTTVDLYFALDSDAFDPGFPLTGHMLYPGRRKVGEALAKTIVDLELQQ